MPRHDEPAPAFEVGDVVYTLDNEFQNEWWYNWPGVVRSIHAGGREMLVEFMGFDEAKKRQTLVPYYVLRHIDDHQVGARVNRIVRQLKAPDGKPPRGLKFDSNDPRATRKLPVEMFPDEDEDDLLS